jgi:hypothetical protein
MVNFAEFLVADIAANEAYNKSTNQIAFDNFMAQAYKQNILQQYKKGCIKGIFGSYDDVSGSYNDYYYQLYCLLIQIKVINGSFSGIQAYFSLDYEYTIDTTKLTIEYLKTNCETTIKNDPKYVSLNCFTIDYKKLVELLKTYNYQVLDQINILNPITNKPLSLKKDKPSLKLANPNPKPKSKNPKPKSKKAGGKKRSKKSKKNYKKI